MLSLMDVCVVLTVLARAAALLPVIGAARVDADVAGDDVDDGVNRVGAACVDGAILVNGELVVVMVRGELRRAVVAVLVCVRLIDLAGCVSAADH